MCLEFIIALERKRVRWTRGREVWVRDGAGSLSCVLKKNTLLLQCPLHPSVEMGTRELSGKPDNMPRGNFAFSRYPMLHPKETGMSSCWVSHIALVQTSTYYERKPLAIHVISALSLLRYWIHSVIYSLL